MGPVRVVETVAIDHVGATVVALVEHGQGRGIGNCIDKVLVVGPEQSGITLSWPFQ